MKYVSVDYFANWVSTTTEFDFKSLRAHSSTLPVVPTQSFARYLETIQHDIACVEILGWGFPVYVLKEDVTVIPSDAKVYKCTLCQDFMTFSEGMLWKHALKAGHATSTKVTHEVLDKLFARGKELEDNA